MAQDIEAAYERWREIIWNSHLLCDWAQRSNPYLHHIQAPLVDGISMGYSSWRNSINHTNRS
jgi:hypothetical protein